MARRKQEPKNKSSLRFLIKRIAAPIAGWIVAGYAMLYILQNNVGKWDQEFSEGLSSEPALP